jgi:Domain of unknown function (DUF4157)
MRDSVMVSRKKTGLSNMTNPSLVSPNTETLASPIRSFTPEINTSVIQTVPEVSSQTQSTGEQVLELEALKRSLLGHDISRISLRPQGRLNIGQPGDMYEQEADMMANRVMFMSLPTLQRETMLEEEEETQMKPLKEAMPLATSLRRRRCANEDGIARRVQREPMLEEEKEVQSLPLNASIQRQILLEEEEVQTKPSLQCTTDGSLQTGGNIETQLNSSKGGGSSLSDEVRGFMEPRFGHDFSKVRVHRGGNAVQINQELGAQAFAHGSDIYFGAGKLPGSNELTAHELTHVVQQTGAVVPAYVQRKMGDNHDLTSPRFAGDEKLEACYDNEARLTKGNNGESARKIQQALIDLGAYDLGSEAGTGIYGDFTWNAVKKFKKDEKLGWENMGDVGPGTMGRLNKMFPDSKLQQRAKELAQELQVLIDGATWKEIRKRVYPKESAAGVQRAKDRHMGKIPDLTGLGQLKTLDHFANEVRDIQKKWGDLKTPTNRVKELGKAINKELTDVEVPEFLVVEKAKTESKGFFTPTEWKFSISDVLVSGASLSNDDAGEVANTALHEGRHAEQRFLSARFSAGVKKNDSAEIVAEQGIPSKVADKAVEKKFDVKTDPKVADLGQQMYQSLVTDGDKNQKISDDDGLSDLAKRRSEAQVALGLLNNVVTEQTIGQATKSRDALREQIAVVEEKYTQYRNIPHEADAHEVGDAAEQAFKGWS